MESAFPAGPATRRQAPGSPEMLRNTHLMPISAQSASAFRNDFLDFTQALIWERDIAWSWIGVNCPIGGVATFDDLAREFETVRCKNRGKPCQACASVICP